MQVTMESGTSFWLGVVICAAVFFGAHTWGNLWRDPNEFPTFGDSGLPKNCKAIIQRNLDDWHSGAYTADAVLNSIERNCSVIGYSWGR